MSSQTKSLTWRIMRHEWMLLSREKTLILALPLSQPVSIKQFVLGKILLRGVLVIGIAVTISMVGLLAASPEIVSGGDLWRVAGLTMLMVLYGTFWFGLAVLMNAFGQKSSSNALALIGIWIALVLIVPAGLNLFAKAAYPLPSRIEMVQALRRADKVAEDASGYQPAYRADLLRKSEEEAIQATNNDYYAKAMPLEAEGEKIAKPVFDKFQSQRLSQQALTERLKYLSPAAVTQIALSELANNSAENFNAYTAQVEAYWQKWRDYLLPAVKEGRFLTRDEMTNVPRYQYVPEPQGRIVGRLTSGVLSLVVYAAVTLLLGFALLRKYPAAAK